MPIGYSEDVKLDAETKKAKGILDILTSKLEMVKREFEAAEAQFNKLYERQLRIDAVSKGKVEKVEKRRPSREEE